LVRLRISFHVWKSGKSSEANSAGVVEKRNSGIGVFARAGPCSPVYELRIVFASSVLALEDGVSPQVFRVYDVVDGGTRLANGKTFISITGGGIADGFRIDVEGNLWCGWGGGAGNDGVMVFNSAGEPIGHIDLPERCANVCFGGFRRSRLFMTASHAIYAVFLRTQGAPGASPSSRPNLLP